jgi:hypothetical protein
LVLPFDALINCQKSPINTTTFPPIGKSFCITSWKEAMKTIEIFQAHHGTFGNKNWMVCAQVELNGIEQLESLKHRMGNPDPL